MTDARPTYIDSLTPLRGIAALWVVVFDFDSALDRLISPETTGLLSRGYLWVDFFFLLSGFIICHVYGERLTGRPTGAQVRSYVMARFSRIYPLHLFTLLLVVGLWVTMSFAVPVLKGTTLFSVLDPSALLQNIALLHAMGTTTFLSWNVPSWSIAAEWWTYLIAVLLFPFLNVGKGWRNWLSIASCLAGLVALEQIHPRGALDITWDLGVVRCLLSFTIGVGLYQLYRSGWGETILRRDASFVAAALLTLVTASAGLTYRFVEIPARDWIRRRTSRPVATEAVVTIRS